MNLAPLKLVIPQNTPLLISLNLNNVKSEGQGNSYCMSGPACIDCEMGAIVCMRVDIVVQFLLVF